MKIWIACSLSLSIAGSVGAQERQQRPGPEGPAIRRPMPPRQREDLQRRWREIPEEKKRELRQNLERFRELPREQRERLAERLEALRRVRDQRGRNFVDDGRLRRRLHDFQENHPDLRKRLSQLPPREREEIFRRMAQKEIHDAKGKILVRLANSGKVDRATLNRLEQLRGDNDAFFDAVRKVVKNLQQENAPSPGPRPERRENQEKQGRPRRGGG